MDNKINTSVGTESVRDKYDICRHCELCPRRCNVDRTKEVGYCRVGAEPLAARAALHMWEEPCVSGSEGSGTIFFCGCTLGCVYCQNSDISRTRVSGRVVTAERLAQIFVDLQSQGANNINLVTPTMFQPHIITAVSIARSLGLALPVLYNTSGYELPERISELVGTVDVWLPDFKYLSSRSLSAQLTSGCPTSNICRTSSRSATRSPPTTPNMRARRFRKWSSFVRRRAMTSAV